MTKSTIWGFGNLFLLVFYAQLCMGATLSPTMVPTPMPTLDPLSDPKVGTAFAPTTPGGLCLNAGDYEKWTSNITIDSARTGFDVFPSDLQKCSTACVTLLVSVPSSPDYGCGGFPAPACDKDIFRRCVKDCLGNTYPNPQNMPNLQMKNYTQLCSGCMGNLSYCGATKCTSPCIQGSFENADCRTCNVLHCNDDFMICSGLNPTLRSAPETNFVPIVVGAVAGGLVLLVVVALAGFFYRQRTRKHKMLTPEELAVLAASQGASPLMSASFSPLTPSANLSLGSHVSNPVYQKTVAPGSPASGSSLTCSSGSMNLTPYQQQYLAQQEALAKGALDPGRTSRMAPSQRVSAMAAAAIAAPPQNIAANATHLVVIYDFVAERDDELTAKVGAKMLGIEQQEGWWLAQDERGIVGLIPVNYTAVDENPQPSTTADPNF